MVTMLKNEIVILNRKKYFALVSVILVYFYTSTDIR